MDGKLYTLEINKPPQGFPFSRFFQALFMVLLFIAVSLGCIFFALGYRINLAAGSIQQTGIIEMDTINHIPADVYFNGTRLDEQLPIRKSWLFPGYYTLEVKKAGYQTWSQSVQLKRNSREQFRSILLVCKVPQPVAVPVLRKEELIPTSDELNGILVNQNELYINGEFITRTSQDILGARWFPGKQQVVYQTGRTLWLATIKGFSTAKLITTQAEGIIPYTFRENGRILIYQDGTTVNAVALYESNSFIDRLGAGR